MHSRKPETETPCKLLSLVKSINHAGRQMMWNITIDARSAHIFLGFDLS